MKPKRRGAKTLDRICESCGSGFLIFPSRVRYGYGKFCSQDCSASAQRGAVHRSLEERFWDKVDTSGDCWLWTGATTNFGYGRITARRGVLRQATHLAWEWASGSAVPAGWHPLHTCDVPQCVRNDDAGWYEVRGVMRRRHGHLFLGTQADNIHDCLDKGRHGSLLYPSRTRGERSIAARYPGIFRGARNGRAKLTPSMVEEIRDRYRQGGVSQERLAGEFGIGQTTISRVIRGLAFTDRGDG
jgi:hypothetical protein